MLARQAQIDDYDPAQAAARALVMAAPDRAAELALIDDAGPHLRQAAAMAKVRAVGK
jgi:hypothetical protein